MKTTKEVKVAEAIKRMRKMGILENAIQHFEKSGKVYVSMAPYGILYGLTKQQKSVLKQFEEKRNALVYAVINTETMWGELDTYIYVTDHSEEWEFENDALENGIAIAYVYNQKMKDCPKSVMLAGNVHRLVDS